MYKGKKYTDLTTGNIIEIKDHFEDIAILDNNSKIKLNRLLDKNFFDEYIDPSLFFKNDNLLSTFAQKIKQIPDEIITNMNESSTNNSDNINGSTSIRPLFDEPAVLQSDPEVEKEELMRKYNIQSNPINDAQRQLDKFKQLLGDENEEPAPQRVLVRREEPPIEEKVQEVIVNRDEPVRDEINQLKFEDPIITMFKNCKRNKEFKITLDIENKIPRPDFIEMMEDSYNTSIIEFLADEFTNNLLSNPNIIKDKIKSEISKLVYGDSPQIKEVPTDKPKTIRKSTRTKKETHKND